MGVVILKPKVLLHLTTPYARISYAPEQIESMSAQKADATIGVFCIIVAFFIQVVSLVFVQDDTYFFKTNWMGRRAAVAVVAIFTILLTAAK